MMYLGWRELSMVVLPNPTSADHRMLRINGVLLDREILERGTHCEHSSSL